MRISRVEIEHVSRLARLALQPEEIEAMQAEMDAMLDYVELLNELDTEGIEPTSHAIPMENAFREDSVQPSLSPDEALANAPERAAGGFRVPRVIE